MQRSALAVLVVFSVGVAVVVPGCSSGPRKGDVKGKVLFKGRPVKEGGILFQNLTAGGAGHCEIGPEGSYEIKGGLVVGDYVVIVEPLQEIVDTDPGKTPPSPVAKKAPDIPMKYRNQDSTPLKATVKEGKNDIDFDLSP